MPEAQRFDAIYVSQLWRRWQVRNAAVVLLSEFQSFFLMLKTWLIGLLSLFFVQMEDTTHASSLEYLSRVF